MKDFHCLFCILPVNTVRRNPGYGRIILADPVKLLLQLHDLGSLSADIQIVARIGRRHAGYISRGIDEHIIAVIVAQDLNGRIPFIRQILGTPLMKTAAVNTHPITIRSKDGLLYPRPGEIIIKNRIYQNRNIFVDIPALNPFLVISGGAGNGKVFSFIPIPLRKNPI